MPPDLLEPGSLLDITGGSSRQLDERPLPEVTLSQLPAPAAPSANERASRPAAPSANERDIIHPGGTRSSPAPAAPGANERDIIHPRDTRSSVCILDAGAYPHIVDAVIEQLEWNDVLAVRQASHGLCDAVDRVAHRHVSIWPQDGEYRGVTWTTWHDKRMPRVDLDTYGSSVRMLDTASAHYSDIKLGANVRPRVLRLAPFLGALDVAAPTIVLLFFNVPHSDETDWLKLNGYPNFPQLPWGVERLVLSIMYVDAGLAARNLVTEEPLPDDIAEVVIHITPHMYPADQLPRPAAIVHDRLAHTLSNFGNCLSVCHIVRRGDTIPNSDEFVFVDRLDEGIPVNPGVPNMLDSVARFVASNMTSTRRFTLVQTESWRDRWPVGCAVHGTDPPVETGDKAPLQRDRFTGAIAHDLLAHYRWANQSPSDLDIFVDKMVRFVSATEYLEEVGETQWALETRP